MVIAFFGRGVRLMELACWICGRQTRQPQWLYDGLVCPWCSGRFGTLRQLAFVIDYILLSIALGVVQAVTAGLDLQDLWMVIVEPPFGLLFWGVFALKDSFWGMSPGKWLTGLQVVNVRTREPASVGRCLVRNLPLVLPVVRWAVLLAGVVQVHQGERWGDGWARTRVVWRAYAHKLPFDPEGLRCLYCGYSLRGNVSGICPECGRAIGPELRAQIRKREQAAAHRVE